MRSRSAGRRAQFLRVKIDNRRASAEQLEQLRAAAPRLGAVVIVAPARRDPIVAIALFIRDVVGAVGNGAEVMLLLTGSSSDAQRLQFWRDFQAEHQLGISIEPGRARERPHAHLCDCRSCESRQVLSRRHSRGE